MPKINLILLFIFISTNAFSQRWENADSYLYYNNGTLKVDTTLHISKMQFKVLHPVERDIIIAIHHNTQYSPLAHENGIKGTVIAAFDCDTNEIKNIRVIKKVGAALDEAVIAGIKKAEKDILKNFKRSMLHRLNPAENNKPDGTYYFPVNFRTIDFEQELKKTGTIPITKESINLIYLSQPLLMGEPEK